MLIDIKATVGDSGAPVVMIINDRPMIVGVVAGMHRQTERSVTSIEERTTHMPLGVSIVSQSVYLRETIELMIAK